MQREPSVAWGRKFGERIHASILTYLDIKKADFYRIETTVDGKRFVTARGWSDLSDMIRLYEQHGIRTDESLIGQYLQNPRIAKDFAIYYDLFNKYRSDYQVPQILEGQATSRIKGQAICAKFDERLALLGLLLDAIGEKLHAVYDAEAVQTELLAALKNVRTELAAPGADPVAALDRQIDQRRSALKTGKKASSLSEDRQHALHGAMAALEAERGMLIKAKPADGKAAFAILKKDFDERTGAMKKQADDAGRQLSNLFIFCEEVFDEGQEILILVTELTISYYGAHFISRYGCKEYFAHNKELLFYERQKEIITELEKLEL